MPTLNAQFVLILPHGYRARAFGVMQSGLQISQFAALVLTGVLADHFELPLVVGLWSLAGTFVMLVISARWPRPAEFDDAADQAAAVVSAAVPRHALATSRVTPEGS